MTSERHWNLGGSGGCAGGSGPEAAGPAPCPTRACVCVPSCKSRAQAMHNPSVTSQSMPSLAQSPCWRAFPGWEVQRGSQPGQPLVGLLVPLTGAAGHRPPVLPLSPDGCALSATTSQGAPCPHPPASRLRAAYMSLLPVESGTWRLGSMSLGIHSGVVGTVLTCPLVSQLPQLEHSGPRGEGEADQTARGRGVLVRLLAAAGPGLYPWVVGTGAWELLL